MGMLDGILGQIGAGNLDVASLAQQVGIDPAMAEKAIAALGQAHDEPSDTLATAAQRTGLDTGTLDRIVGQLGGEGALGQVAGALRDNPQILSSIGGMLDRDGDGNPLNDILGMASGLFGKK